MGSNDNRCSSRLVAVKFLRGFYLPLLVSLVLLSGYSSHVQVEGLQIFHEFSRKLADFIGQTPFARQLIDNNEPWTTPRIIRMKGYPVEVHRVTTEDGYILELHRVPSGIQPVRPPPPDNTSRIPVIVMHGGLGSSADWTISPFQEDCLAFHLANRGYDVWLGNIRGNQYSNRHVNLTVADAQFWEYTANEIGTLDLAATINYVINETGQPRVHYTGVSMGASALLILLAKRPEYNSRIRVGVLMAPGGIQQEESFYGLIRLAIPLFPPFQLLTRLVGDMPMISPLITNIMHRVLPILCQPSVDILGTCQAILYAKYGHDNGLITRDTIPLIASVAPTPISLRVLFHAFQQAGLGEFSEYDYGITENLRIYGTHRPPPYNLTNVRAPMAIIAGPNDKHVTTGDALKIARRLTTVVGVHNVANPNFHHIDFSFATGVGRLVYDGIAQAFDVFSN